MVAVAASDLWGLVYCNLPGDCAQVGLRKAGWSLASQRWLEVNDLGRLVNRYGRRQSGFRSVPPKGSKAT